jgi:isoamylase
MTHSSKSPPLGATLLENGVHFAVFSTASFLTLYIFPGKEQTVFQSIPLDPKKHKEENIWSIYVPNLRPPFCYLYKVHDSQGSFWAHDPYAKSLETPRKWKESIPYRPMGKVLPTCPFDWEGIKKPCIPHKDLIIYEMHVRGFTIDKSSQTIAKGTFLGMIEKIPYLLSLGINAVELLPIFEFPEMENKRKNPLTGKKLCNFWGYSPVNFFSPMQRYAEEAPIHEFKTLVKELHRHGIAVILDVVYNHTAEHGINGRTFSFKALSKGDYYLFDEKGSYANYSGTGNTLNCNNPITSKLIIDSLCYFAEEMQVDGFRFDLASILTRSPSGSVLENPPILQAIEDHPILQKTILIAEAWDAAGLYQVGKFPSRWSEWNGKYRDVVRKFIKGTDGMAGPFATALCGSQDLYFQDNPIKSINFITSHDGYSLEDLVSYQQKHNFINGEEGRDGSNDNHSWNCGIEGLSANPDILKLRDRQKKNFLLALMISLGIPMVLMGDEYAHTRMGNNNPYCQDEECNWFLWEKLQENASFFRFVQYMIQFRKEKKHLFCRDSFLSKEDVFWHGKKPLEPDWGEKSRLVAFTIKDLVEGKDLFIAFNADYKSALITLPPDTCWVRKVDTFLPSPDDCVEGAFLQDSYLLQPYSSFLAEKKVTLNKQFF